MRKIRQKKLKKHEKRIRKSSKFPHKIEVKMEEKKV